MKAPRNKAQWQEMPLNDVGQRYGLHRRGSGESHILEEDAQELQEDGFLRIRWQMAHRRTQVIS
mgnify:CR=1 FL=1